MDTDSVDIFDRLLPLRDDPEAFEAERQRILSENISQWSEDRQQAARQLDWQIQATIRPYKGVNRYNKMVELFWHGVGEFKQALENLK